MNKFDVVIVGAGLAGLQCAKLLGSGGASVLLVDRKTDLAKGIHTTGIFVAKTFEDFDFRAGTLGRPVRNVTLYSPNLKPLELKSGKDEFRVGKMGKLYEAYLQECLDSSVQFASGTRYVSASMIDGGAIIRLESGGKSYEMKTKVLVGADGANSRVAKDLGLDENREWIVGYEEVYHAANKTSEPRLHCFLDAELAPGYLAWIADDGEEIHIGVGGYPAGFNPREALKIFKDKVGTKFVDWRKAEPVETRGGRIPVGGVLRRIANEHGLLIGDAAGAVSPLTAGGLDPCMRMSRFASAIIEERLKTDEPRVLLQFSGKLFRARFTSRLWMRRIISIFTKQELLELGCWFLRGRIGSKLAKHVFFGRGSFPDVELQRGPAVFEKTGY
jgi:flavin-dependent dehydrogenase